MVFLNEFFVKVDLEKNQQITKKNEECPRMQRVNTMEALEGFLIFQVHEAPKEIQRKLLIPARYEWTSDIIGVSTLLLE